MFLVIEKRRVWVDVELQLAVVELDPARWLVGACAADNDANVAPDFRSAPEVVVEEVDGDCQLRTDDGLHGERTGIARS